MIMAKGRTLLTNCRGTLYLFCLGSVLLLLSVHGSPSPVSYKNGTVGKQINGSVSRIQADIYAFNIVKMLNSSQVVIVNIVGNASREFPLLVVVQQQKGGFSWTVPFSSEGNKLYQNTSHILCPTDNPFPNKTLSTFFTVTLSTYSTSDVPYTLYPKLLHNFMLQLNLEQSASILPPEPMYYLFQFPANVDSVLVKATSPSSSCSILSVQGTMCPVFDLARNVEFSGNFQTMRRSAGIVVQKQDFPSEQFYVVLVMLSSEERCKSGKNNENPFRNDDIFRGLNKESYSTSNLKELYKIVRIKVVKIPSEDDYGFAIVLPIVVFLGFYVSAGLFIYIKMKTKKSNVEVSESTNEGRGLLPGSNAGGDYGSTEPEDGNRAERRTQSLQTLPSGSETDEVDHVHSSINDASYDFLKDIEEDKEIYRLKKELFLSDLSKKKRKRLQKKYNLYQWNLVIIAVFYALPVTQLVFTYQRVLNSSGDQDICYYNFYCSRPLGPLSSFNNVYSNIGYVMLGILFFLLVWRRDVTQQKECGIVDEHLGIPQHYGVFYALGLSLIMEGILSACYHVCPSYTNFQFDTSFMYIIACLIMVQLYQTRHPDLAAKPHVVFGTFAVIILVSVSGVVFSSVAFWVIFCLVLIAYSFYCTTQMYFMGRINFSLTAVKRSLIFLKHDLCSWPTYKDRMVLLVLANAVNLGLAINGIISEPKDFASYLLAILIINGLIYLLFYVVMKIRNGERLPFIAIICSVLTVAGWAGSLTFFLQGLTSWQKSPAMSREHNKDCILLNFYDDHDVWHFLSAVSLFLSFMVLLTMNDDLTKTPRNQIRVF